jgi:hypothetical protein
MIRYEEAPKKEKVDVERQAKRRPRQVEHGKGGFDRTAYQRAYMREYMRKWRAKQKADG